jgi:hypothetical protein
VFRRDVDGDALRFAVVGMWGSGNVVGDRDPQGVVGDDYTAYTMWDGHALFGPGRPGRIDKFPALVANLDGRTFLERYRALGDRCEVWEGAELLGIGCDGACADHVQVCETADLDACLGTCSRLPRSVIRCIALAASCEEEAACRAAFDAIR